ncbi:hypothetical protein G6F57_019813 [Rhizopus arrhizus]|nr:hypothetical protein G6F57_019813 [Rhizopus arrhizus]
MKHAILHFRDRQIAENPPEKPVSVALVTGSLGPGGAERQLTRLAGELTPEEGGSAGEAAHRPVWLREEEAGAGFFPARAGQGADPGHGNQQTARHFGVSSNRSRRQPGPAA